MKLIDVFCRNLVELKVDIYDEIQCLDPVKRAYLAMTNWHCTTIKGQKEMCPMMEVLYINDNMKIIKGIGIINMSGLGDLLTAL